jgi:hypothetical protein
VFGWSRPYRAGVLPDAIDASCCAAGLARTPRKATAAPRARARLDHRRRLYFHSAWPTDDDDAVFFGPDTYRYVAALGARWRRTAAAPPVRRAVDIGCGAGPGAIEAGAALSRRHRLRRPTSTTAALALTGSQRRA